MAIKVFTAGERLFAADLNDNFSDLDGRTTTLEGNITISAVTQAVYDAIPVPDSNVLYVIVP